MVGVLRPLDGPGLPPGTAGPMTDLNTLISSTSGIYVFIATNINDRGEIAGSGVLPNGDVRAVLLIPCGEGTEGCRDDNGFGMTTRQVNSTPTMEQHLAIRRMMAGSRMRYHIPGLGAPRN